ncbi:hypothetical protein EYF80_031743 [Liparis tanakae]|uniref:Uncharacterized protein n=1 Tax=Liparis tanakae TaxID=230148 RepID=A0A4Z2GXN7_9TELE|nr:hypothetical protein EYF80_031743 [Liparis tanakae]
MAVRWLLIADAVLTGAGGGGVDVLKKSLCLAKWTGRIRGQRSTLQSALKRRGEKNNWRRPPCVSQPRRPAVEGQGRKPTVYLLEESVNLSRRAVEKLDKVPYEELAQSSRNKSGI